MAVKIPAKFDEMINRLIHREAIQGTKKELEILKNRLEKSAKKLATFMGIFFALSLFFAFFFVFGFKDIIGERAPITLLESGGGFIAGTFLGCMCGYGRFGWLIQRQHLNLKIQPGHPDEVGGLKPVGDFYFRQAMVVALPAAFLAIWLLIIQLGYTCYSVWRTTYVILLSINIIVEILVFVIPLLSFNHMMVAEKQKQLQEADELSKEIALTEHQLSREQDVNKRELIKDRLSSMTKEYWDIEKLPVWPISKRTNKLFKRNNLTLLVPLLIDIVGRTNIGKTSWWHDASNAFENLFK